jgi:protein-tyrosine kinase
LGVSVSIIEKALGKRDQNKGTATPSPAVNPETTPEIPVEPRASIIAEAIARNPERPVVPDAVTHSPGPILRPERQTSSREIEIDLSRLHKMGMVTPDGGRTAIAEEFRLIKRPLIESAFSQNAKPSNHRNLIMVTSAIPGEGKTFCAINLAMSMAMERDHTVMLVDADVARPSVLRFLGLKAEPGLMDILHGERVDPASVMLKTNIDSFTILPAGQSHKHATELLASQAMSKLLDEIASRYPDRIVIFDSPPLLLTTEARALASQMGQIVLVVEAEGTTQHAVKDVIRQLGPNANVNLVYNKARAFSGGGYAGHYYS